MNNLESAQFEKIFTQLFVVQDSRLKTAKAKQIALIDAVFLLAVKFS